MPTSSSAIFSLTLSTACEHALAQEDLLVAVAQLPGFVHAGARAAGHGGGADRAVVERDIDFDGRIAAAIENLASVNVNNHAHGERLPFLSLGYSSRLSA